MNEKIYYNVDTIHQAISMNRQISFRYFEYDIEKNKRYRNSGEKYVASPYALTWDDENYYMISRYEKHEGATHFRVDKMEDIEVLDIPSNNDGTINVAEYAKKVFGMFSGEELSVRVMFDNSLVGVVIDRFGKSVIIRKVDEIILQPLSRSK
jgi:predicted DNA-binding transcriptional regulator YafY